jgi:isopentenyl diphosphate isomerase/L-lactate dehydrogenase-like FMN-dependent dehydrogenase
MNDQGPPFKPLHPVNLTTEQDARLIRNGYEPVAVEGKRALGDELSKRLNTIETIAAERKALPHAVSTGLRTGQLAAKAATLCCQRER